MRAAVVIAHPSCQPGRARAFADLLRVPDLFEEVFFEAQAFLGMEQHAAAGPDDGEPEAGRHDRIDERLGPHIEPKEGSFLVGASRHRCREDDTELRGGRCTQRIDREWSSVAARR